MQSIRTLNPPRKARSFKFLASVIGLGLSVLALSGLSLNNSQALALSNNSVFNRFSFGLSNDTSWTSPNFGGPANVKLEAGPWVLDNWYDHNSQWLQKFNSPENNDKIPYLYLYVIAGNARKDWGLQDCNVGAPVQKTLCYNGANYVRNNTQKISNVYQNMANNIKTIYGTSKPILLHLEPDFFQYHQQQSNQNYPLSLQESWDNMNLWTSSIKNILPNASLVMDISPWIHYSENFSTWSRGFNNFDYAGLVGGKFNADGDGSIPNGINGISYSEMSKQTGKKLIVNTAHGAGGSPLDYNYSWTVPATLVDRWNDGVVAVLQSNHDNFTLANNTYIMVGNNSSGVDNSIKNSSPVQDSHTNGLEQNLNPNNLPTTTPKPEIPIDKAVTPSIQPSVPPIDLTKPTPTGDKQQLKQDHQVKTICVDQ